MTHQDCTPFATAGGVVLHHPAARVERIALPRVCFAFLAPQGAERRTPSPDGDTKSAVDPGGQVATIIRSLD